jgi:hypothetical protein
MLVIDCTRESTRTKGRKKRKGKEKAMSCEPGRCGKYAWRDGGQRGHGIEEEKKKKEAPELAMRPGQVEVDGSYGLG